MPDSWTPPSSTARAAFQPQLVSAVLRQAQRDLPHLTSLLASRWGDVQLEAYFQGDADTLRDIQSVTKSVLSLLVGTAQGEGRLRLDDLALSHLPDLRSAVTDPRWQDVTVRHLLTMTSGARSELTDPEYDEAWMASTDPLRSTLRQPLVATPGETFHYTNGGAHLLGEILARATGEPLETYARARLLGPLGVSRLDWPRDVQGRTTGYGGLSLISRDLLRLGQLVLQGGRWEDQQLVPDGWINRSTQGVVDAYTWMEGIPRYGLMWWVAEEAGHTVWYATGYGGQYLAVVPDADLVVVATGVVGDHPSHRHVVTRVIEAAL